MVKVGQIFFSKKIQKDSVNFWCWKMTLKVQILQSLRRLFIILVGLTMTLFSKNNLDARLDQKILHGIFWGYSVWVWLMLYYDTNSFLARFFLFFIAVSTVLKNAVKLSKICASLQFLCLHFQILSAKRFVVSMALIVEYQYWVYIIRVIFA